MPTKTAAEPAAEGHRVKVCCRVRPLLPSELSKGARACIASRRRDVSLGDKTWAFDAVFHERVAQAAVYHQCVEPLVATCFDGYNATVFAYG